MSSLRRAVLSFSAMALCFACGGSTESPSGVDSGASDSSSAIDARGTGDGAAADARDAPADAAIEGAVDAPIDAADAPPCPTLMPTRRSACSTIDQICFYGCGIVLRCTPDGWDDDPTIDGGPPCP
jgi:hypothetical protein